MLITILSIIVFIIGILTLLMSGLARKLYDYYDNKIRRIKSTDEYREARNTTYLYLDEASVKAAQKTIDAYDEKCEPLRKKRQKCDKLSDFFKSDGPSYFAWTSSIVGGFGLLACIICILIFNSPRIIKQNMDKTMMERDAIVYRIETHDEVGNEYLYNDVVEFNKRIYDYNYYHNSIWLSWFNPEDYTKIEPVDYQKIIEAQNNNDHK